MKCKLLIVLVVLLMAVATVTVSANSTGPPAVSNTLVTKVMNTGNTLASAPKFEGTTASQLMIDLSICTTSVNGLARAPSKTANASKVFANYALRAPVDTGPAAAITFRYSKPYDSGKMIAAITAPAAKYDIVGGANLVKGSRNAMPKKLL